MKKAVRYLTIMAILLANFSLAKAQKAAYTFNSGLSLGFGLGSSYQSSDIANSTGLGFDFTLGSYIYQKKDAFLAVDWKFRFLAGENQAFDHRINGDGTYSNVRYAFFNYDAELGLTLNRLRERTRIIFTGFGGLGITHGRTWADLLDASTNPYDYSGIDPGLSAAQVKADLISLSDNDFETALINKAALLPTAGIYLGYQFTRSFSIGIEHKINFSLNEGTSFFGIDMDNIMDTGSGMDMMHYTSIGFRWSLGGGSSRSSGRSTYPEIAKSPIVHKTPVPITDKVVTRPVYQADTTKRNILRTGTLATSRTNTNRTTTNQVTTNNQAITNNQANTNRIVTSNPEKMALPEIRFINPATPVTVDKNIIAIKAQTENVAAWQDVEVKVNGRKNSNFSFTRDGVVMTNIALNEGANRIEILGKNKSGKVTEVTIVTYKKALADISPVVPVVPEVLTAPTVTITTPARSPLNSYESSEELRAKITGIDSQQKISLLVNGSFTRNFTYNKNTKDFIATLNLKDGQNTVVLSAINDAGADSKNQIIIKKDRPCPPPTLRVLNPSQQGTTTQSQVFSFRTSVRNITEKNQLELIINGNRITNYSFNGQEVQYSATLASGINTFIVNASTDCGSESVSTSINYTPPVIEETPCYAPLINFSLAEVNRADASHELSGSISNILSKAGISISVNGNRFDGFQYQASTGEIKAKFKFNPGTYKIIVRATNECGTDSKSTSVTIEEPCIPPQVNFSIMEVNRQDASHELKGILSNVKSKSDITITLNGNPYTSFQYLASTGELKAKFKFNPGSYRIIVSARSECGTDSKSSSVTVEKPCLPPVVSFTVNEASRGNTTHELKGRLTNVENKSEIKITVNNKVFTSFTFTANTGDLSAGLNLLPGKNTIIVKTVNACGEDSRSVIVNVEAIVVEEKPCGVRINPGNAQWQFCLVTPRGTYNRDNLSNSNFSYSGSANSLYFKPIAGGGDAIVNGKPYKLNSGSYYLFTGNLKVTVSTKNPGSMGQWSVCITASKAPVSGNGNNRPPSPCETENNKDKDKAKR